MKESKKLLRFILIMTILFGGLTGILLLLQVSHQEKDNEVEIDFDTMNLVQLECPSEGDTVAVVDTTIGTFSFVLYPEYSPAAVENFIELAESGYYDNTYVFHSESGAYSAMGCPQKNGELPEEYDNSNELTERELSQNLWPFKGAVCSLSTTVDKSLKERIFGGGTYYNGSRFAVLNTIEFTDEMKDEMLSASENTTLADAFIEKGGIPNFSQQMTVIGQTYEGMDVVEKLSQLETDNNGIYKIPQEDIMINHIEICEYTSENEEN